MNLSNKNPFVAFQCINWSSSIKGKMHISAKNIILDLAKEALATFVVVLLIYIIVYTVLLANLIDGYNIIFYFGCILLYLAIMIYKFKKYLADKISKVVNICDEHLYQIYNLNNKLKKDNDAYKITITEVGTRFPTLLELINIYDEQSDYELVEYLCSKKHPAVKSSEIVKLETQKRRHSENELRKTKFLVEYYETIAPFLVDLKEDTTFDQNDTILNGYSEKERQDPITNYLTIEEYRNLSSIEKNQRALDRFWARPKSNSLLGKLYERYIGYKYEVFGYNVEYIGIFKGYEDLGRDLICRKENDVVLIQCKNWSKFKTIYEKHIFQFFGTFFQYKHENNNQNIKAIFYTTTRVSDLARCFALELGIGLRENYKFDQNYPCIKCNISMIDNTKIYHLPFDQQYDKVKIDRKGEFYCATVKEAEEAGFRRAFRYAGIGQNPKR